MTRLLWICAAGALGTGARYLLSTWLARLGGTGFPWGTLAVNLIGSFLLGVIMQVGLTTDLISPALRVTLASGLLGGFTTYSSFNYETLEYLRASSWLLGCVNVGATVAGCLFAGALGIATGRLVAGG